MCDAANSAETDHPPLASTGNDGLFYIEELIQSICLRLWLYTGYHWTVKEYVKEKGFTLSPRVSKREHL